MKIALVYESRTGNTARVAEAIRQACEDAGHEVLSGRLPEDLQNADLIFLGSWTDKGCFAASLHPLMEQLHNKAVALFGTAGFGGSPAYFDALARRAQKLLPPDNRVLGSFYCIGRMPEAAKARYEALLERQPGDPNLRASLDNYERALPHPNTADLAAAGRFARSMLAKL